MDRLFSGMRSAASALSAERLRLDVIAENIANARNTRTASGGPYLRKVVHFQPILRRTMDGAEVTEGVRAARVVADTKTPLTSVHDPSHPDADATGTVHYPNVNSVLEMADMVSAVRSYQSNLALQEVFLRMAERALELAR